MVSQLLTHTHRIPYHGKNTTIYIYIYTVVYIYIYHLCSNSLESETSSTQLHLDFSISAGFYMYASLFHVFFPSPNRGALKNTVFVLCATWSSWALFSWPRITWYGCFFSFFISLNYLDQYLNANLYSKAQLWFNFDIKLISSLKKKKHFWKTMSPNIIIGLNHATMAFIFGVAKGDHPQQCWSTTTFWV